MNRFALVASVLSLLVSSFTAVTVWRTSRSRSDTHAPSTSANNDEVNQKVMVLGRQMEALRLGLAVRADTPRTTHATQQGAGPSDPPAGTLAALAQRLGELEQQTAPLRRMGMLQGPLSPTEFTRATATALDRQASVAQRVEALRSLRPINGRADGRTPEVTRAMVELIEAQDTPARMRADIVRQMEEIDHPHLKKPLVAVLSSDTDPETRAETVETLQSFYGDPEVLTLVTKVKDTDPDPRVRKEAEERLADFKAGRRRG